MQNIRWAVLGTGVIANEMAVTLKKNGRNIDAVGNRTHEKAVAFAEKYDKDSGIGTLISTMVPYSIVFLIGWSILLMLWFIFKLPLGVGVGIFM